MDTTHNQSEHNEARWATIGRAVREILQESKRRRVVIRNRTGQQVLNLSVLLALILSVGAPVIPAFVILGVLVEAIQVSIDEV